MKGDHPKIETTNDSELSPLEQIRHTEAEVTRRIAAARQEAERTLAKANSQAAQYRIQAREEGLREGQAQYQELVSAAEKEAKELLAQTHQQVTELQLRGKARIFAAVDHAVAIILSMEGAKQENHEHRNGSTGDRRAKN